MTQIRVGIIGLGFMGRTHLAAYRAAAAAGFACTVTAVADAFIDRVIAGNAAGGNVELGKATLDLTGAATLKDPRELLTRADVDLVSVCTPTDTHVELGLAALGAGKHVLMEKPVALRAADVQRLADAARAAGTICMPAMCMRFWPGWAWLRDRIRSGEFGRVRSAVFQRLGSPPDWSTDFYRDYARTGGPLFDLHIHDVDFIRWCFGEPREAASTGSLAHVTSLYRFDTPGPEHVLAEGGQDHSPGFGFRMRYVVVFERATADFDLGRSTPLLLYRDGKAEAIDVAAVSDGLSTGYDGEVRHVLDLISGRAREAVCTMEDAVKTTALLERERANVAG